MPRDGPKKSPKCCLGRHPGEKRVGTPTIAPPRAAGKFQLKEAQASCRRGIPRAATQGRRM